jgi:hypothetical protein
LEALRRRGQALDKSAWLPDHNHLFMKFDGAATAACCGRAGKVDPEATDAIGSWINLCMEKIRAVSAVTEKIKTKLLVGLSVAGKGNS